MVCHSDVYHGSSGFAVVGFDAGRAWARGVRRQLHLIRNLPRHHESKSLTCLRRDEHRVGEFDLLLFEVGDLRTQLLLSRLQLLHLGALPEIGAHRTRDGQREHAYHGGEDGGAACSRAEPLLGLLFGRRRDGFADRSGGFWLLGLDFRRGPRLRSPWLPPNGLAPRGRPLPVSPAWPAGEAGDRRFGSGRFASGTGYLASTEKRGKAKSPA